MKSLILDLEDNGGGYLNTAISMADEFLKQDEMIVYTEGAHQRKDESFATSKGLLHDNKLVVLIDESSASASEILSGAIQDWDRGVVVGRRSFGKGLVQRPIPLPDGSMIRLTVARYYTPSGRCIQKSYEEGVEKYHKDLIDRYNNGEMEHADSIHFPDSLKAFTKVNHRVVYGGGGIMPDYFVPIDTSHYTNLHRDLVAKGILNKYCINYIDKNRAYLKKTYPKIDNYMAGFEVTDGMIKELLATAADEPGKLSFKSKGEIGKLEVAAAADKKAKSDSAQLEKARPLIVSQMKALIARDLFDSAAYFKVVNAENETMKKAIDILRNESLYNKLLGNKSK
jgi:carboxyl-terminal processing protease